MLLEILTSAILGLAPLHEMGYRGDGVTIAVIDAGFFRANDSTVFDQTHIIGSYDLIPDSLRAGGMFTDPVDYHGTSCLSTMLYESSMFTGTAPDANYILIRSEERAREDHAEVDRLVRALELADSLDADVISISLGYYEFDNPERNYTYEDMNGMSEVSQKATEIAGKGRILCVAAGNEGNKTWHYIDLPADAQDILTVGAVSADSSAAAFTSWGPTADGRQKPEVSAWGQGTIIYDPAAKPNGEGGYIGELRPGNGTSFSTPEIAGMCACLRQALPHRTAAEIREAVIRSCHLWDTPDEQRGYGIPDAWKAYQSLIAMGLNENENENENENGNDNENENENEDRRGKIYRDGQILIRRGGRVYTIYGTLYNGH